MSEAQKVTFEKWALGLFAAGILGAASYSVNRLDRIEETVTQIRVDVATLKAREVAALRP